ncbi:RNA polymerase sigma factor [Streptomyces sp. NPDC057302]|uniref:RNA polymerase sigma factor n=1 Tax=Streptomyces sp. NPDC057302 TaxID=3346094 RepID=UPI00363CCF6A
MQGDFSDYYFRSGTSFVVVEVKGSSPVGCPVVTPAPPVSPAPSASPPDKDRKTDRETDRETDRDFTRCYKEQMGPLVRHLMRQGAAPHEAAEAVQAAFAEAFAQWRCIAHPASWLRTVAFRQYMRRPAREEPVADIPDLPGGVCPLNAVELRDEEARVYAALATLPPLQRRVMAWALDEFSTAEISKALETTEAAVRQNVCRARARLKQLLLNEPEGGGR